MNVGICSVAGQMGLMIHLEAYEITVQIPASLLEQAKHLAAREHTTMRALIEEGLRPILADREGARPFKLRKASFKGNGLQPGLASTSWQQIRHASYGGGA